MAGTNFAEISYFDGLLLVKRGYILSVNGLDLGENDAGNSEIVHSYSDELGWGGVFVVRNQETGAELGANLGETWLYEDDSFDINVAEENKAKLIFRGNADHLVQMGDGLARIEVTLPEGFYLLLYRS